MELTIENVGPIERVAIPVPEGGGVVVLTGPNGAGKSTALKAAAAIMGSGDAKSLTPRDGETKGSVSLGSARLSVGRTSRKSGKLTVEAVEGAGDLASIVDPGIADPERADRARMAAILRLVGDRVSVEELKAVDLPPGFVGDHEGEPLFEGSDLVEAAAGLRKALQAWARVQERKADTLLGERKSLPVCDPRDAEATDEDLRQAVEEYEAAVDHRVETRAMHQKGVEIAKSIDAARARAKELEASAGEPLGEIMADVGRLEAELEKKRELIERLRDDLKFEEGKLGALESRIAERKLSMGSAKRLREARQDVERLVESLGEFPQAEAVEAAEEASRRALQRVDAIKAALAAKGNLDRAEKLSGDAMAAASLADMARRAAGEGIDKVLSGLVGVAGLQFADGRLCFDYLGRGVVPFADLSDGERWRVALNLAMECSPENALLVIPQSAWEGLDAHNRKAVNEFAVSSGVVILTAEAAADEAADGIEAVTVS